MAQYARPDSDIALSSWAPSTGSYCWDCINETPYSDTDYMRGTGVGAQADIGLSNVTDPSSGSGHIVRLRAKSNGAGAVEKMTVTLRQGTSVIATILSAVTIARTFTDYSYTLTSGEADAITDYTALFLRFYISTAGALETIDVSWAEMEVPDAGGTQYPKSVDGTLSSSGVANKMAKKDTLAGVLSSSGGMAKLISKTFLATADFVGNLYKLVPKTFSGILNSSGLLSSSKVALKTLAGVLNSTGTLYKFVPKTFLGILNSSGGLVKQVSKTFSGIFNSSGIVSTVKVVLKSLSGSLNSTGDLIKQISKTFSGTFNSAGNLAKRIAKAFSGILNSSGIVNTVKVVLKSLSGILNSSGSLFKLTNKQFTGVLFTAGNLYRTIQKTFLGTMNSSGTIGYAKVVLRLLVGSLSASGNLIKGVRKALNGALSFLGTAIGRIVGAGEEVPGTVVIADVALGLVEIGDGLVYATVGIEDVFTYTIVLTDQISVQNVIIIDSTGASVTIGDEYAQPI